MNTDVSRLLKTACVGLLCTHICGLEQALQNDTVEPYIEDALEHLLSTGNEYDPLAQEDILTIKEHILTASSKPTVWQRILRKEAEKTSEDVQKIILNSIVDFVEKQSYTLALEKTNNKHIAKKVSNNLHDFIKNRVGKTSGFKSGSLSRFVGTRFRATVYEQCSRYSATGNTTSMRIVKCKICRKKRVESECITLSPCKHIACKKCTFQYFFEQGTRSRCPYCSKTVDVERLKEVFYTTNIQDNQNN